MERIYAQAPYHSRQLTWGLILGRRSGSPALSSPGSLYNVFYTFTVTTSTDFASIASVLLKDLRRNVCPNQYSQWSALSPCGYFTYAEHVGTNMIPLMRKGQRKKAGRPTDLCGSGTQVHKTTQFKP